MIFWGWGSRSLNRQVSPQHVVIRTYRYFALMFIFSVAFKYRYELATATPQGWATRPVSDEEALQALGGEHLMPNLWRRFSLWLLLAGIVGAIVFANLFSYS
ncbi:hypothetical protein [Georgenia deserti]|uniref:DUF1772 domain-containing protein n=1 Tax=Georgenia deserti TaxID=2093781 RepID=A0ABW4KXU0_9MICO